MLKKRIIPTLLYRGYNLYKGAKFDNWRLAGALLPAIKVHSMRDVDELLLIDLDAAEGKEPIKPDILKELTKSCLVPITYAGGICSVGQIREMLLSGADKIVINTSSFSNVNLITEAANVFGTQCIVGGVDYKYCDKSGGYVCYSHCGLNKNNTYLIEQVKNLQNAGVGELLITSIEHDGLMEGFDYSTVKLISKLSQVPIIASGGCGGYHHMHQAFQSGADAIAAGSLFLYTECTPKEAKYFLTENKIPVRI